jgi:hypothetical protein
MEGEDYQELPEGEEPPPKLTKRERKLAKY